MTVRQRVDAALSAALTAAHRIQPATIVRILAVVLAVPVGFLLLEIPTNEVLFAMDVRFVVLNLGVLAFLFAIVFLAGQRSRAAIVVFLAACLVAGTANHFVIAFKGQPIVPADLFALSTAASVGSGYAFALDGSLVLALGLFAAACVGLWFVPKARLTPRHAATNTVCAVVLAVCFGCSLTFVNFERTFGCTVDVWSVKESYADQGSALCFLKRVQDLAPNAPEDYDPAAIAALLAEQVEDATQNALLAEEAPHVVVIMNETFSDLSRYPGLANSEARPASYYEVAANAVESGDAYVSALGGGTCNSEFEFLTGSSMGHLGGGVYPYVLYDLDGTESLVSYFASLGYDTHAVHPAEGTNWRRDRVYEQLGFDSFADATAFEDADTLRGLVTDRATYDHVLAVLESADAPQFVFDVTLQNHGGYDMGIDDDLVVNVALDDGTTSSELDEYVSVIRQADRDLAYLVDRLDALDRPVVLCFFGDHQPGFSDWLFAATHDGATADELGLDAVQERYTVPYLIWENEAARTHGTHRGAPQQEERTSLNYLGAKLVDAAGLPTTAYQRFLLTVREQVPAVNLNGFLTADGTWHRFGEDTTDADEALALYAAIQYDNLFNKDAEWRAKP